MMLPRGGGIQMERSGYGVIEKCPCCDATNIPKASKNQMCCGKINCRREHANARARAKNSARAKSRRNKK